ncbi:hypothetical protein Fot_16788 [Forsythia ovata]|uniref:Uncharacterized protein n=1 Tax=Forsythia ovata TaxID=205694 RepID=A0ABD1VDK2_9LAMI
MATYKVQKHLEVGKVQHCRLRDPRRRTCHCVGVYIRENHLIESERTLEEGVPMSATVIHQSNNILLTRQINRYSTRYPLIPLLTLIATSPAEEASPSIALRMAQISLPYADGCAAAM